MTGVQEVHVYLNGEFKGRSTAPKEEVVVQMRRAYNASLLRECRIREPKSGKGYLKMRFIVPRA